MAPVCYVCGSAELAIGADPRNPTCEADKAARTHTVSMQRDPAKGDSLAACACGWFNRVPWGSHHDEQDRAVRAHWRSLREAGA